MDPVLSRVSDPDEMIPLPAVAGYPVRGLANPADTAESTVVHSIRT